MDRIWYIQVDGKKEGPFSFEDLKKDRRLTPDSLVWKEGFKDWKKIRDVPELEKLFNDDGKSDTSEETEEELKAKKAPSGEDIAIDMGEEPPYLFWLLILILILTYIVIQIYWI